MTEGRFEMKYALPAERREEILARAAAHVQVGAFAQDLSTMPGIRCSPGSPPVLGYRVHSLYFDSPELHGYGLRLADAEIRNRLRIRTYGDPGQDAPVFMEAKRKLHKVVVKHRVMACTMGQYAGFDAHQPWRDAVLALSGPKARIGQRWLAALEQGGMVPVCITHYVREVWEDGGARLTLDHLVRASGGERPGELQRLGEVPLIPEDWIVLELKYNDSAPHWMRLLVRDLGLRAEPVSKFALAVARTVRQDAPAELLRLTPPSVLRAGRAFVRQELLAGAAR